MAPTLICVKGRLISVDARLVFLDFMKRILSFVALCCESCLLDIVRCFAFIFALPPSFPGITRMPYPLYVSLVPSAAIDNAIGVFVAREFIDTIGVTFGFIQVFLGIGSGSSCYCKVFSFFHIFGKDCEWRCRHCILFWQRRALCCGTSKIFYSPLPLLPPPTPPTPPPTPTPTAVGALAGGYLFEMFGFFGTFLTVALFCMVVAACSSFVLLHSSCNPKVHFTADLVVFQMHACCCQTYELFFLTGDSFVIFRLVAFEI